MHPRPRSSRLVLSGGHACRIGLLLGAPLLLAGCPDDDVDDDGAAASSSSAGGGGAGDGGASGSAAGGSGGAGGAAAIPTHTGIVSIQDASIVGAPAGVPGLTVQVLFTAARAPAFDEHPGQPLGCKVWVHDVATAPPPPLEDHGVLQIDGVAGAPAEGLACAFEAGGYACTNMPAPGADPIPPDAALAVALTPGGGGAFDAFAVGPITAGSAFTLGAGSLALLADIPLDGAATKLGCAQPGSSCGPAQATLLRMSTTDAPTDGLGPFDMPPATGKQVEMQCVMLGGDGDIAVPAQAMALLTAAHRDSPITRIRTAFMREGVAIVPNEAPSPPNTAYVLVGHGLLGFSNP